MPEKIRARTSGRFLPGQSGNPAGRPRGTKNQATLAIREFAREFLASETYRENLKDEIVGGAEVGEDYIVIDVRRELERGNESLPLSMPT